MVGSLAGGGPGAEDTGVQDAARPRRRPLRHGRRAAGGGGGAGRVLREDPARREAIAVDAGRRLGLAGFFATAVTFGPARNGYGLFLPEIRSEFGLSTQVLGFVASGLYAGYLGALLAVGLLAARTGPRLPVLVGLLSAGGGMALVALSPSPAVLAAGVVLAGTGAGWSWAPYNDAVGREVPASSRDRVLSIISTGTTFGITVAGVAALAAASYGMPRRAAWVALRSEKRRVGEEG